jgi:hypothetical protein
MSMPQQLSDECDQGCRNAVDSLRVDIQMAQTITPGADDGFPLVLEWTTWDNTKTEIEYTLVSGELQRKLTTNDETANAVIRVVGRNIEDIKLNPNTGNNTINVTIVSSVDGFQGASTSRTFEILPRPGS